MGWILSRRLGRVVRGLWVVAAVALVGLPAARAGDEALAEFLLKAGREALEKGDYDDAFSKLKKSFDESLHDFEVQYWLGLCCEKRQDLPLSAGYYRLFLRNVDDATRAGVLPGGYGPLAKKARARLDVIAAASNDRSKLDEALAAKLVALARKQQKAQPEVARRAARWAWRLVGDTSAVLALLTDLGEDPRPKESKGPVDPELELLGQEEPRKPFADLPEVTQGKSSLYQRVFGFHKHWTWEKGVVTIDCPDQGLLAWPVVEQTLTGRFIVELEARSLAEFDPKWGMGIALGTFDAFLAVFFGNNQVVVVKGATGAGLQDVTGIGLTGMDARSWQRLSVRGDGAKLTVWLDGKQVLEHTLPQPFAATTGLGLWYQKAKLEVRTLRAGRLP